MAPPQRAILVDTTVLIDLLRRRPKAVALVRDLAAQRYALAISCITIGEIYAGLRKGEEAETEELLLGFEQLPVTGGIAKNAGAMVAERRRRGRSHSLDDMLIAATAMAYEYPLLTDNRKDFQGTGLCCSVKALESWMERDKGY